MLSKTMITLEGKRIQSPNMVEKKYNGSFVSYSFVEVILLIDCFSYFV